MTPIIAQIAPLRRADVGYGWQVAGGIPPLAHCRADVGYGWQVAGGIPPLAHRLTTGGKSSIVTPPREKWKGHEVTLTDFTYLARYTFLRYFDNCHDCITFK